MWSYKDTQFTVPQLKGPVIDLGIIKPIAGVKYTVRGVVVNVAPVLGNVGERKLVIQVFKSFPSPSVCFFLLIPFVPIPSFLLLLSALISTSQTIITGRPDQNGPHRLQRQRQVRGEAEGQGDNSDQGNSQTVEVSWQLKSAAVYSTH